ncbi:hypothetical protein TIFTF001_041031 [Ficus carica]|uniref:SHSP domain-containing protein n=1 Tax=Ficus carica TaxID=3494 RepID=A0AA87Z865_FICCA|nr:hypothetical protein TIFTF001_041031 [Ficus carica]
MAWRPQRDGGVTARWPRQANRPVYEDFQPQTDTNEEEGARIVILRVPGFLKEQMTVTSEHGNNIRVQGKRPLMNNRWSRFNLLLPAPENCDKSKIHAKFENGNLTITMPKEVPKTTSIPPKVEKPASEATQADINKSAPPKASESEVVPPSSSESNPQAVAAAEQREQKGQEQPTDAGNVKTTFKEKVEKEGTPQTITSSTADEDEKQRDGKMAQPLSPQKVLVDPKRQKGTDEEETSAKQREIGDEKRAVALADPQKYTSEPNSKSGKEATSLEERDDETKKGANERRDEPEKAEKVVERNLEKEKEMTLKGKESLGVSAEVSTISKILDDGKKEPKKGDDEMSTNENKHGIAKPEDESWWSLNNFGAALLAILAGVTIILGSLSRREN